MKKALFVLLALVATMGMARAYDFSAVAPSGQTLYYEINGSNVTVVPPISSNPYYSTSPTGALTIPSSVTYNGTTYSVTSIGYSAFSLCSGLTSVTIPNSVTIIGNYVFYGCSGLTSVTIPNSVTIIGNYAFYGCSGLTSVTIPNFVTSIGNFAFESCRGLTSMTVAADNTHYDSRNNCNAIIETSSNTLVSGCKTTVIPNSVTAIGRGAFKGCSGLTSVTIPNSVTSIGDHAFDWCSGLTSVTIPNSVTSIGNNAFYGCSGLTSVTIPNSVTSIIGNAFGSCDRLTSMTVAAGNTHYDSRNNCNAIIESTTNTLIAGCMNTVIPNSVTSIGQSAFFSCDGLTAVTIPNSVTSIGVGAFKYCSGLTSVTIPNSVTSIGNDAFYDCSGLTSVTIGNSVTSISNAAFSYCYGLTSVICKGATPPTLGNNNSIPTTATITVPCGTSSAYRASWGSSRTYQEASLLYELNVASSNDTMGTAAVQQQPSCTSGTAVIAATPDSGFRFDHWNDGNTDNPRTITMTGDTSFLAYFTADNTPTVTVGDIVIVGCLRYRLFTDSTVAVDGFESCIPANLTIPSTIITLGGATYSVTSIGAYAFWNCIGLTSVTIPNSVTSIGEGAFYYCSGLTSVTIPNSVTSIGSSAFFGCSGLTSVTIGNSVTSIGSSAFFGCSGLTSVTIGNSVTSIGPSAFAYCSGLTSVICKGATPPTLGNNSSIPTTATITVPCGATNAYTTGWGSSYTYQEASLLYDLNVASSNDTMGTASVTTLPTCADPTAVVTATANNGYHFDHWSDGNTNNPRSLILTQDTTLMAYFVSCNSVPSVLLDTVCDSHTWNGITCTTTGSYVAYIASCSRDDTLHLVVNHYTDSVFNVDVCDRYTWMNGQTYTATTTDTFTITNVAGCDSVNMLNLTIRYSSERHDYATVCYSYTWTPCSICATQTITVPPTEFPTDTIVNVYGCDSVAILHLTIHDSTVHRDTVTVCDAYTWNGNTYQGSTASGVKRHFTAGGNAWCCDSISYLHLTIHDSTRSTRYETVYDSYTWNGRTYYSSGTITDYTTNRWGCDSVIYLHLTILDHIYTVTAVNCLGAGTYQRGATAIVMAAPQAGLRFRGWSDGTTANPRYITVTSDTTLTPLFTSDGTDTVVIYDTVRLNTTVYDTTAVTHYVYDTVHHHQYDTLRVLNTVYDTTTVTRYVYDTVRVYDTLTIVNIDTVHHYDTTRVCDTLTIVHFDTLNHYMMVSIDTVHHYYYDTTRVFDTLTVLNFDTVHHYHYDTTRVLDTLTVVNFDTLHHYHYDTTRVFDTLTVLHSDTLHRYHTDTIVSIRTEHRHDTTTVYDTLKIVRLDTVHHYFYAYNTVDTLYRYVYDTTERVHVIYDTTSITHYIYTFDTVYIYDTIYMNSNGIDGAAPANMKVYTTRAEIVVEGTEGMPVQLYDISGRLLERRDEGEDKVKFLAPASGTYVLRIGDRTVRKVVVIR